MKTAVRWAGRFSSRGVCAKAAWLEIERIRETRGGEVRPADIVQAARPIKSPLHRVFDWKDRVAAGLWREEQARRLLRSIEVTIIRNDGDDPETARAYMNVAGEDEDDSRPYVPMPMALSNADMRKQVLDNALRELEGWKARYARYQALAPLARQIDAALRAYRNK